MLGRTASGNQPAVLKFHGAAEHLSAALDTALAQGPHHPFSD